MHDDREVRLRRELVEARAILEGLADPTVELGLGLTTTQPDRKSKQRAARRVSSLIYAARAAVRRLQVLP